jgi:2-methylcitrate dehydratase PrpD
MPFTEIIDQAWDGPPPGTKAAEQAGLLLLDCLGCALAGLAHGKPRALAAALAPTFPGAVRLPGCPPLGPAGAAAVLAAAMPWDEANEGLARAHGRPGLAVAPLALVSLLGGATLAEAGAAFALGYEVAARAGEVWRLRPGMHVDGSWHALGAAAAAARLGGGDRLAAGRAVRLAACQVPFSLYAPITAGMDGRNSYPAHAVLLGQLAAAAAVAGMDAPATGFAEARALALGLEDGMAWAPAGEWLLAEAYMKPFAGVRHSHYAAAAALQLRAQLPPGLLPETLVLDTYAEALRYAGNRAPTTAIGAQFSLSWAVAASLCQGDLSPAAYTDAALADPGLRQLEQRVVLREDTDLTATGGRGATLTATLPDQSVLEVVVDRVDGDPGQPMPRVAIEEKVRRYLGPVFGEAAVTTMLAALNGSGDARPGEVLLQCMVPRSQ